jgi:hypothetical protein
LKGIMPSKILSKTNAIEFQSKNSHAENLLSCPEEPGHDDA